jgi:FkbH-like protein
MKKCLILDLDNTLWGGIVGEDGVEGISLSLTAPGNSFMAFQQAILDLHDRGVILAINSRNNPEDALKVIREHPNMILKEHHFSALKINWNDKATNVAELALELNIGLDSMVFLDDDRTNRLIVKSIHPLVEVPELPDDPKEYTKFLQSLDYFSSEVITDEDKMRGNLYVTERLRREVEKQYDNYEDYLNELGLELQF